MKRHWMAIVLAVVIGLIVGLPHLLIPKIIAPEKYDPLQFSDGEGSSVTMEEVYTYAPEVREILEGKFWVTDTQVAEYNGRPTPFAGETGLAWVMAGLVKLTGSMENAFMAADFLFPAVTFLLVYAIVLAGLPRNDGRMIAVAAGAVVVLWPELVALIPYPGAVISGFKSAFDPRDFLLISRNFHPQLSLPAYLFAFWLVMMVLKGEKDKKGKKDQMEKILINLAAGLAVGFLFYTYIFNWTAFIFGFGLFFLWFFFRRHPVSAGSLLIIISIAGLMAVPYFWQVWEFRQTGLAEDFFVKLSLPKRGFFDLTARHWIFVLVFSVVNFRRLLNCKQESPDTSQETPELKLKKILFLSFWIAPLILPDLMQNLLGRDLEGKHWVRRIGYPWSIMGLGFLAGEIKRKWINAAAGIILSVLLVYGVMVQTNMFRKAAAAYAADEDKQKLYDFINLQTPPGSVAASLDWDAIVNIPAKTHAFNFSPIGMRTIAPIEETLDRFLWAAAIYDKDEDWVRLAFGDNGMGTTRVYYFAYGDENQVFKTPPEIQENAVLRYRIIKQRFLAGEKPPFRLDYVFPDDF